jgi:hypothetical protein
VVPFLDARCFIGDGASAQHGGGSPVAPPVGGPDNLSGTNSAAAEDAGPTVRVRLAATGTEETGATWAAERRDADGTWVIVTTRSGPHAKAEATTAAEAVRDALDRGRAPRSSPASPTPTRRAAEPDGSAAAPHRSGPRLPVLRVPPPSRPDPYAGLTWTGD